MIVVINYGTGNIGSVSNALMRLNYDFIVSSNIDEILSADKIILPGVGEASSAMNNLIDNSLDKLLPKLGIPTLGICLGMQLMCISSEENKTKGLGIFKTKVRAFPKIGKVPHMGWNNFSSTSGSLYKNVSCDSDVYYVHGYYAELCKMTSGVCEYFFPFSASLEFENFYGTQYHPEKSGKVGSRILENFLNL